MPPKSFTNQIKDNLRNWKIETAGHARLERGLTQLEDYQAMYAAVLRERFIEGRSRAETARRHGYMPDGLSKVQTRAINALAELLWVEEQQTIAVRRERLERFLPPQENGKLFGVDHFVTELIRAIETGETAVHILTGLGGIGKTAVMLALARRFAETDRFKQIFFLRIDNQQQGAKNLRQLLDSSLTKLAEQVDPDFAPLPFENRVAALRNHLRNAPYLILVDNIEDKAIVNEFVRYCHDLGGPSKFLLTSRVTPNATAAGHIHSLTALPEAEAIKLFRYHAQKKGIRGVADLSENEVKVFVDLVGGHPLAIKLASGLLHSFSPQNVQKRLQRGTYGSVKEMYGHVYTQVWEMLDEAAQMLLITMGVVGPAEADEPHLLELSGLPEEQFQTALETLNQYSLLETRGTLQTRLYGIHRLTETFLQTDIIGWTPPSI
ncbi:MAG: NB-ARC domain-containing protein [Chloroflexota bacterium]